MKPEKTFFPENIYDWHNWLETNYKSEKEVWLIFYKKHTGKKCITYNESVEEALCFGWIDSIIKRINDEKYMRKFTPRINNDKWSDANISRLKKLISAKRIKKEILNKIPDEILNKRQEKEKSNLLEFPKSLEKILIKNETAHINFINLSPSCKKQYIGWICSAKKEETQIKRLGEAVSKLERGEKLGLK